VKKINEASETKFLNKIGTSKKQEALSVGKWKEKNKGA